MKYFLICILFITASYAEVRIAVNASSPLTVIQKSTLTKIYLNGKSRWDQGGTITPCILKYGPAHEEFLSKYISKSPHQFRTFWKKQVFTGKGSMPKEFSSENELLSYIANHPGSIGYISDAETSEQIKILTISD
jgi:ABC-type phosphate transport system substrate-binding protein